MVLEGLQAGEGEGAEAAAEGLAVGDGLLGLVLPGHVVLEAVVVGEPEAAEPARFSVVLLHVRLVLVRFEAQLAVRTLKVFCLIIHSLRRNPGEGFLRKFGGFPSRRADRSLVLRVVAVAEQIVHVGEVLVVLVLRAWFGGEEEGRDGVDVLWFPGGLLLLLVQPGWFRRTPGGVFTKLIITRIV